MTATFKWCVSSLHKKASFLLAYDINYRYHHFKNKMSKMALLHCLPLQYFSLSHSLIFAYKIKDSVSKSYCLTFFFWEYIIFLTYEKIFSYIILDFFIFSGNIVHFSPRHYGLRQSKHSPNMYAWVFLLAICLLSIA